MEKTLGESIAEMESYLEACREADRYFNIWKIQYSVADDVEKKQMIKDLLGRANFSDEEIEKCLK